MYDPVYPPKTFTRAHSETCKQATKKASLCHVFLGIWVDKVILDSWSYKYCKYIKIQFLNAVFFFRKIYLYWINFFTLKKVFQPEPHTNVCFAFCSRMRAVESFRTSHSFDSKWVNWCMLPWILGDVSRLTVGKNGSLHFLARGYKFGSENKILWISHEL